MNRISLFLPLIALLVLSLTVAQVKSQQAAPSTPTAGKIAVPTTIVPAASPADGEALLQRAIYILETRHSITADISHEVNLFGQQLTGNGSYYEKHAGPRPLMRMELRIPFGDRVGEVEIPPSERTGSLVRVCDGRFLWTYRRLLDDEKLSRVDMDRVARAMEKSAEAAGVAGLDGLAGAGGFARLLRGLNRSFRFEILGEGALHQTPIWKLRGQWRPDALAKLLPGQEQSNPQKPTVDLDKLPSHLPDQVILFLAKQDLFPLRLEYRRREAGGKGGDEGRMIVTMQLDKVNVNVPIDSSYFDYRPGDIQPDDETDAYLRALGLSPP